MGNRSNPEQPVPGVWIGWKGTQNREMVQRIASEKKQRQGARELPLSLPFFACYSLFLEHATELISTKLDEKLLVSSVFDL